MNKALLQNIYSQPAAEVLNQTIFGALQVQRRHQRMVLNLLFYLLFKKYILYSFHKSYS